LPRGEIRPLLSPEMLRKARELADIDQGELARLAGISRKTVVVVERELPAKIDPRRRVVLERIRSILEEQFLLEFDTGKQQVKRRAKSRPKRAR
jgi:DNA-binding XRE family transcriptional regulator